MEPDEYGITPREALSRLDYFVNRATKWNEGAEELAREERIYDCIEVIQDAMGVKL